jgi:hypothetical protein
MKRKIEFRMSMLIAYTFYLDLKSRNMEISKISFAENFDIIMEVCYEQGQADAIDELEKMYSRISQVIAKAASGLNIPKQEIDRLNDLIEAHRRKEAIDKLDKLDKLRVNFETLDSLKLKFRKSRAASKKRKKMKEIREIKVMTENK